MSKMQLTQRSDDPVFHIAGVIRRIPNSYYWGTTECGERGTGRLEKVRESLDVPVSEVCEQCLVMALAQGRRELFDFVPMSPLPEPIGGTPKHPYAVKHGFLRIGKTAIRCYELSDGQRIFGAPEVKRFLASVREGQGG